MKHVKARKPETYIQRNYRAVADSGYLVSSFVRVKDTDLHILADREVSDPAQKLALQYRLQIEKYIQQHPEFAVALSPLSPDSLAPPIVKEMLLAGRKAGVGPMAAVAGVIAEYVGKGLLLDGCREVMVENGGDIYIKRSQDCLVAIFAGESSLSMRTGDQIVRTCYADCRLYFIREGWSFFKFWPGGFRHCHCQVNSTCRCSGYPFR